MCEPQTPQETINVPYYNSVWGGFWWDVYGFIDPWVWLNGSVFSDGETKAIGTLSIGATAPELVNWHCLHFVSSIMQIDAASWRYFVFFLKLGDDCSGEVQFGFSSRAPFFDINERVSASVEFTAPVGRWSVQVLDLQDLSEWYIQDGFDLSEIYGFGIACDGPLWIDNPIFTNGTASVFMRPKQMLSWRDVNILLAMDEDFMEGTYENPIGTMNPEDYARLQINRACWWFSVEFGINFVIRTTTTWDSDDDNSGEELFYELLEEVDFTSRGYFNGFRVDVMVAWTGQTNLYVAGLADNITNSIILTSQMYPFDDNTVQHELSHIFDAEDGTEWALYLGNPCYEETCIMTYRTKYVSTIHEDGKAYEINSEGGVAYTTNRWCSRCWGIVDARKDKFQHCLNGC